MRLFLYTALTMMLFATNSLLNRAAVAEGLIGPGAFALIRLASGAAVLAILMWWRQGRFWRLDEVGWASVGALVLYVIGFSFAYVSLGAGLGTLVLFGCVQVTMFAGAVTQGERPAPRRWAGAGLAFAGLIWLVSPAGVAPAPGGVVLMVAAGFGWGVYSLIGNRVTEPLSATAGNFLLAAPFGLAAVLIVPAETATQPLGIIYGLLSGMGASGLGYALWYSVLPRIDASEAAVAQLSVPVIAVVGGALFLGEAVTSRLILAACVVLAGVALAMVRRGPRRA